MTNSTTPGYPGSNDASPGSSDTSLPPGANAPATGATYDPTYDETREPSHDSTYDATSTPTSVPAAPSAREEAEHLAKDAGDAGRRVAETAKEETKAVGSEARRQARWLADQVGSEVRQQAATQQSRAAGGLRTLGDDFSSMAHGTGSGSGIAFDLARQAGDRFGQAARWLDDREPRDLLEEVKGFARRRPGVFIGIAVGAGVVVGRLTRALMAPDGDSRRIGANGASIGSGIRTDATREVSGTRMDDASVATGAPGAPGVPGVPGVTDSETVVTETIVTGPAEETVDPVTGRSWAEGRPATSSGGIR